MKHGRQHGITLIELVVAMALFALVAVMGLQALTGTLRMRDRLVEIDTESSELSLALSLMRSDLSAMVPMLFYPPDGAPRSGLDLSQGGQVLAFSVAGQVDLPPRKAGGFHRVIWRFDPARQSLSRRIWPVLYPAEATAMQTEVEMLGGVTGVSVRSHWPEKGWIVGTTGELRVADLSGQDGDRGPAAIESYSDALPQAVEITIDTQGFGRLVLLETLK